MDIDKTIIILYMWKHNHSTLCKSMYKYNYPKFIRHATFFKEVSLINFFSKKNIELNSEIIADLER